MPDTGNVGIISSIAAIIGAMVGGAISLIGWGKKIERVESGLARSHERIDKSEKKVEDLEHALKSMMSVFTREDGEPRFITKPACSEMQTNCHQLLAEKLLGGEKRFSALEAEVKEIKTAQDDNLRTIIKAIEETRK